MSGRDVYGASGFAAADGTQSNSVVKWNGSGWSANAGSAVPVFTRGAANPMSVQFFGDVFVSVTKADDWWGTVIYVDRAPSPQGPWTTVQSINVLNDRKCSNNCGNYSAFLMPWLDTTGRSAEEGPRWRPDMRDLGKFVARHPPRL